MAAEQMRLSPAKLLIVVALCVVILIELRTVLAFFSVDVAPGPSIVLGLIVVTIIVLWATLPLLIESHG